VIAEIAKSPFAAFQVELDALLERGCELVPTLRDSGTRVGGEPDLPDDMTWPTHAGRPLTFLAQIDLAAVASAADLDALPKTGWLWFFVDTVQPLVGFAEEEGRFRVLHAERKGARRERPSEAPRLEPTSLVPTLVYQLPCNAFVARTAPASPLAHAMRERWRDAIDLDEAIRRANRRCNGRAAGKRRAPRRHLLGHPRDDVSGSGARLAETCTITNPFTKQTSSINENVSETTRHLLETTEDWVHLASFDDEDQLHFGDCWTLHFVMPREALRSRDFTRVWIRFLH
jgi:uncharacterized protein YwqG